MLIVTPLGPGAATYFLDGPVPGRWVGAGPAELGLDGNVVGPDLRRVLRGQDPRNGRYLPEWPGRRRAGWDLTFAAPKSLSLVAALNPPPVHADLVEAHGRAVRESLAFLQHHGCWARREGTLVGISGPVAAAWDHVRSAAGDPHLHTHVVIANLARGTDGRWSALAGSPLWRCEREAGSVYRLALRHHVARAGYGVEWELHANGLADVAGVPRAALDAASSRHHEVVDAMGRLEQPNRRVRRASRARTRSEGADRHWRAAVEDAGFGPDRAAALLHRSRGSPPPLGLPGLPELAVLPAGAERAAREVVERGASSFSRFDVIRALAATWPGGASGKEVVEAAGAFCQRCLPLEAPGPETAGRWTTPALVAADRALAELAGDRPVRGDGRPAGRSGRPRVTPAVPLCSDLPADAREAVARLCRGAPIEVLGGDPGRNALLAQAAVLDRFRAACEESGFDVAVWASPTGARRWDALAGVRPLRTPAPGTHAGWPAMLVVDQADRRTSAELGATIEAARAGGTRAVILVEGGTLPARRRPVSAGLVDIGERMGRIQPGKGPVLAAGPVAVVEAGRVRVGPTTAAAVEHLASAWAPAYAARRVGETARPPPASLPILVGLGPAEVEALNRVARALPGIQDGRGGPTVDLAGRPYQRGDRVIALRRGTVPAGACGWVTDVDPAARSMRVSWASGAAAGSVGAADGRTATVDRYEARGVAHAYAMTPAQVRAAARVAGQPPGSLYVLGPPDALGQDAERVEMASVVGRRLAPGICFDSDLARLEPVDGVGRAAGLVRALEVDGEQARRAGLGPMPDDPAGRQRWQEAAGRLVSFQERFPDRAARPHGQELVERRRLDRAMQAVGRDPDLGLGR